MYWCIFTHVIRNYKENILCAGGAKVFIATYFLAQKKRTHSWGKNESCNIYKRSKWIASFYGFCHISNVFLKIALHLIIQVRFTCQSYARVKLSKLHGYISYFDLHHWFDDYIVPFYAIDSKRRIDAVTSCHFMGLTNWPCGELFLPTEEANLILAVLWVWRYYMPFPWSDRYDPGNIRQAS